MELQLLSVITLCIGARGAGQRYAPTWESLDARPLPGWYDGAKVGVFLHWGVFSVPSYGSEWFWAFSNGKKPNPYSEFMEKNYPPGFSYQEFAPQFTAEFFEPEQWAALFNASGAQYVVLTSKHHEGYTNWPSKVSWNWNSMDVGPKRDLVGDLANAIRKTQPHIHFGVYHSLYEWYNPIYLSDKKNKFKTNEFVKTKTMPELMELVENYSPDVIWSDGDWEASDDYFTSKEFLAWLFSESPVRDSVVVNDRWGKGIPCNHGSFYTCQDRYNPGVLQPHKWENAMTLDRRSWGYRREATLKDYLSIHELLSTLVETVSCGGNLLINAGPTREGTIPPIMQERLLQLGEWLGVNGGAVYNSTPWAVQNDTATPGVWYTQRDGAVYATALQWPKDGSLLLGSVAASDATVATLLGDRSPQPLQHHASSAGLVVQLPDQSRLRGRWAWVVRLSGVQPVHETEEGWMRRLQAFLRSENKSN